MTWKKKIIHNVKGNRRYELTNSKYTIDVQIGRQQGFAGSNQVNVYSSAYGGWILDTPKNFSTIAKTNQFIKFAKDKLDKGEEGKKVPFPR